MWSWVNNIESPGSVLEMQTLRSQLQACWVKICTLIRSAIISIIMNIIGMLLKVWEDLLFTKYLRLLYYTWNFKFLASLEKSLYIPIPAVWGIEKQLLNLDLDFTLQLALFPYCLTRLYGLPRPCRSLGRDPYSRAMEKDEKIVICLNISYLN